MARSLAGVDLVGAKPYLRLLLGGKKGGLHLTMAGLINFEDENEVKQFLDNLGMEYSFQCYKEKDPEGNFYLRCSQNNSAETLNKSTKEYSI